MNNSLALGRHSSTFIANLPTNLVMGDTVAEALLLGEYGAVFVARGDVTPPDRVVFADADEVDKFQRNLDIARETIGGFEMELQRPAMEALQRAITAADAEGLSITPRGADSARRGYDQTIELWASRVEPALDHWTGLGRISDEVAERIRGLTPFEQVAEVLELEKQGIWFAKDLTKSIIYSVAPPGASQHLSLLAFDVKEFDDPIVRDILAQHRWCQTVTSDLPHFTYLGVEESELSRLGLRRISDSGRTFWIPE